MRRFLIAAGVVALAVAGLIGLAWWFEAGPGFRRQCERLASVAELRPGMSVADVGAGEGEIAVFMAARLGPSGRLYATEVNAWRLRRAKERAAAAGLTNVIPVRAGDTTTGLSAGCCDVIYLRRVYHHLEDPVAIGTGIYSALRPGGRLVVIEMQTPGWLPDRLQHGTAPEALRKGVESAGFVLERRIEWWSPIDYCLVFSKPMRSLERL